MQWLAAHHGWLVILDNVADPADVAPLLARTSAGRYLITSRRASGWHATGAVRVRLDVLDPAEAQAMLAAILAPGQPEEPDGAGELCAELGFLSLSNLLCELGQSLSFCYITVDISGVRVRQERGRGTRRRMNSWLLSSLEFRCPAFLFREPARRRRCGAR